LDLSLLTQGPKNIINQYLTANIYEYHSRYDILNKRSYICPSQGCHLLGAFIDRAHIGESRLVHS